MDLQALYNCLIDPSCLITQLSSALVMAMVLFIVASGMTLIFGVLGVMNFAHGSLYMLGAYFTYALMNLMGLFGVSAIVAAISVGLFGVFMERVFIRRIYGAPVLYQLLLTYAFILILDDVVKLVWGSEYHIIGIPDFFARPPLIIAGSVIPFYYVFIIGMGGLVALGLWLFISKMRLGKIITASAHDPEMVSALGINVWLVYTLVFALGSVLAGLGGVLFGPVRSISLGMGFTVIIDSVIVVVIGGMGSIGGAFLASLILGVTQSFGLVGFPDLEETLPFMLMALVLIARPHGLLGKKEAGGV